VVVAETPFEVIVGAILTQNTLWTNVERAIRNLRLLGSLSIDKIPAAELREVALLVRPSGYFRQKAKRLKESLFDKRYGGSLAAMLGNADRAIARGAVGAERH
jgi:endonuclease-3 related protein